LGNAGGGAKPSNRQDSNKRLDTTTNKAIIAGATGAGRYVKETKGWGKGVLGVRESQLVRAERARNKKGAEEKRDK
jgi:hypothetical protein